MLNRGYAYTTIISSKYHGQTLLSHLASLYPHSTPQAWQQKLNNCEVTLNGVTATGSESVTFSQTLVWNRPPWIEPNAPQHFEVLFEDSHLLAVNKPSGLPTLPGGDFIILDRFCRGAHVDCRSSTGDERFAAPIPECFHLGGEVLDW